MPSLFSHVSPRRWVGYGLNFAFYSFTNVVSSSGKRECTKSHLAPLESVTESSKFYVFPDNMDISYSMRFWYLICGGGSSYYSCFYCFGLSKPEWIGLLFSVMTVR